MTTATKPVVPRAEDQPTMRLWPEVGRDVLGLSRPSTYEGAHRGEIPVIRVGHRLMVPTAALRRMLQLDVVDIIGDNASGTASPTDATVSGRGVHRG